MAKVRLQKYFSQQKIASRRKVEEWIANGWIKINGIIDRGPVILVDPVSDIIEILDPAFKEKKKVIAYFKPFGVVSNCPQGNEQEIKDLLPDTFQSLSTIGRLDKDSEGLILLTNDGVLSNQCLNSAQEFEKEYEVTVDKPLHHTHLEAFELGLNMPDMKLKPVATRQTASRKVCLTLKEGKNRQIRRMLEFFDYTIHRLIRTRYHTLTLDQLGLSSGEWLEQSHKEIASRFKLTD